jgi:hypothetical protein
MDGFPPASYATRRLSDTCSPIFSPATLLSLCKCPRPYSRLIGVPRRYESWLQDLGLIPVPRLSARFPIFFNVVSRARNSFGLASAKTFLISAACLRKIGAIKSLPFWGERYDPDAPILRTLDPAYQPSIQEAVDGYTDRAGRKVHLWADRIHRQRSFVQEGLQYAEVGIVDSRLLKSGKEIFRSRLEGLTPYQPTMHRVCGALCHDQAI